MLKHWVVYLVAHYSILVLPHGSVQEDCAVDTAEATEQFLSLFQS